MYRGVMSRARERPTREETKRRVLRGAADVFAERGIAAATIEEICAAVGLTRGAFYSNFRSKDELVLELIDAHGEESIAELDRLRQVHPEPLDFLASMESERRRDGLLGDRVVLSMEFLLYALRNPANRERLAERQRRWREHLVTMLRETMEPEGGFPLPVEDVAEFILAVDDGYLLHELIEPGSYRPGMFSEVMVVLHRQGSTSPV